MWTDSRAAPLGIAVALIITGAAASATADVLDYRTGFEPPTFLLGELRSYDPNVNDGWVSFNTSAYPDFSAPRALISDARPHTGRQSIEIPGRHLREGVDDPTMAIDVHHTFSVMTFAPDIVDMAFAVRLDGPSTDTGSGSADDLISGNLRFDNYYSDNECYEGIATLLLSSSEELWIRKDNDEYALSLPIALDTYHGVAMRADLRAKSVRLFVDARQVAVLPFTDPGTCPRAAPYWFDANPQLVAYAPSITPPGFAAGDYTAFFDDHRMIAYARAVIAIRPGNAKPPINPRGAGVLPAAIFGGPGLDVRQVDPQSIRIDVPPGGNGVRPIRWAIADVAAPLRDGDPDLALVFANAAVGRLLTQLPPGETPVLQITGKLKPEFGDRPFIGEATVRLVGGGHPGR
jgi:hypothetical protein